MKKRISIRLWFLIAFILFMAPVAIFSFALNASVVNSEILHADQMKWEQFTKAADAVTNMLSRCVVAVEDTVSIQDCFYPDVDKNNVCAYEDRLSLLLEKIETRVSGVECICSIRGNTDIFTSGGRMSFAEYEASKPLYDLTLSKLCSNIHAATSNHLKNIIPRDNAVGNALVLYIPVSLRPMAKQDIIFAFWMDAGSISDFFNEYLGIVNGNFFLYSSQKVECFLTQGQLPLSYQDILKTTGNGIKKMTVNGESYVTIRYTDSGWRLVFTLAEPEKVFYESVTYSASTRTLLTVGLLVFLLIIAVTLSAILYQPIKKLYLSITEGNSAKPRENELDAILKTYQQGEIEREFLENRITDLGQNLTNQFLSKLLFGTFPTREQALKRSEEVGLAWQYSRFCVLYLMSLYRQNMDFLLIKTTKSFSDTDAIPCEIWQENSLCWVVNTEAEDAEKRAMELAYAIRDELALKGIVDVQIGIGRCYDDILRLSDSYIEASVAAKLTISASSGVSSFEEHIVRTDLESGTFGLQTGLSLLQQALRSSDSSVAKRAALDLIEQISGISSSFLMFRYNASRIVTVLQDQSARNGKPLTDTELQPLLMFQSKAEFVTSIQTSIDALCLATSKRDDENEQLLRNRILAYVRENFSRFDFCLDRLTSDFGITASHAANIFQEMTGLSFAKYVAMLRLEEFKRLLCCTNQTVGDCVKAVGYTDVPSFLRKFKTLEGMTPTQYRQQKREEK